MSRNGSGTYTLPAGNPVVTGTIIDSTWANDTMDDMASEMTDSLSRSGKGGMTAPLKLPNGSMSLPALAWTNFPNSGLYAVSANEIRMTINNVDRMRWLQANNLPQVWDSSTSTWTDIEASGLGLVNENLLINGGFDIWQRGTAFPSTGVVQWTADRWRTVQTALIVNQVANTDNTRPWAYHADMEVSGVAGTRSMHNHVELRNVGEAGQFTLNRSVTISYWVRTTAADSSAFNIVTFNDPNGAATNEVIINNNGTTDDLALTANTWTRYTRTITIDGAPNATNNSFRIEVGVRGSADTTEVAEIANVKVEFGASVTDYEARPIAEELSLCQRYFQVHNFSENAQVGVAFRQTTNTGRMNVPIPVTMYRDPDLSPSSSLALTAVGNGTITAVSAYTARVMTNNSIGLQLTITGMAGSYPYVVNGSGAINFLAEV